MGVTPLTGDLPWWATQQGPAGGPGPTGGPAATPQGGGQDWLAYLSQMMGISPAQAAELSQNGPPPGPDYGRPPGFPPGQQPAAQAKPLDPDWPMRVNEFPRSSNFSSFPTRQPPPAQPAPAPVATSTAPYAGPMAAADAAHAPTGGAYSHMPFPGQRDPQGFWGPLPSAGPMAAGGPVGGGGAAGSNATSNPRFTTIDRPNMPAEQRGQARGGVPLATALNLAGGQPQGAPAPVSGPMATNANAQPDFTQALAFLRRFGPQAGRGS